MKVVFSKLLPEGALLITAENRFEAEELRKFNNCVLSAKYDYQANEDPSKDTLLIVKEF